MRKEYSDSKTVLTASLFYTFMALTFVAAMFHLFGLEWFSSTVNIPEPNRFWAEFTKAALKILELVFMYKITIKKGFLFCIIVSFVQTIAVGFLPLGTAQSIADFVLLMTLPTVLRKDHLNAFIDAIALYVILCLYAALFLIAKFGGLALNYGYSFYANIVGIIDYKLFIVTLYLYVKYKGGIKLWMKRKLLS